MNSIFYHIRKISKNWRHLSGILYRFSTEEQRDIEFFLQIFYKYQEDYIKYLMGRKYTKLDQKWIIISVVGSPYGNRI